MPKDAEVRTGQEDQAADYVGGWMRQKGEQILCTSQGLQSPIAGTKG